MSKPRKVVLVYFVVFKEEQAKEVSTIMFLHHKRLHPAALPWAPLGRYCSMTIPSAQSRHWLCETSVCLLHWKKWLSNSLEMVYNSSTTELNQFHAVNNYTYNHTSFIRKHWDGNHLSTDQVNAFRLHSTGFFPCLEKNIPERAFRITPQAVSLLNDMWTSVRNAHIN